MSPPGFPVPKFGCALCGLTFDTKTQLSNHTARHYSRTTAIRCDTCNASFEDYFDLISHKELYKHGMYTTENYSHRDVSLIDLDEPQAPPGMTPKGAAALGRLCHEPDYPQRGYVDLDKPKDDDSMIAMCYDGPTDDSRASTNAKADELQCKDCKKLFRSQAQYNNHFLACTPVVPPLQARHAATTASGVLQPKPLNRELPSMPVSSKQKDVLSKKAEVSKSVPAPKVIPKANGHNQRQQHHAAPAPSAPAVPAAPVAPFVPSVSITDMLFCNTKGCTKSYRSEQGLAQHKKDVHGIGGPKLDLEGRDKWMLGSRGGTYKASTQAPHLTADRIIPRPNQPFRPSSPVAWNQKPAAHPAHPAFTQVNTNIGSIADIEQANEIHHRTLRLLIQSDILIQSKSIVIDNLSWSRITCANQGQILGTLDTMCHLPKQLQGEYLPGPKTFKDENQAHYGLADFKSFSAREAAKPGLGAVVIVCSKVALVDGRQEVVKIAAVDFATGGILMNHLVCTDPRLSVTDWRERDTGLSSWNDLEAARQAGYKVFKGWSSARAALHKYVDSETIIIGYNLRADLDVLRIIHGRGVDIIKVVEKAGNGSFTKLQLALDGLCRDTTARVPGVHDKYGRNPLLDAFAVRELLLWKTKDQKGFETMAKRRVAEAQLVAKRTGGS